MSPRLPIRGLHLAHYLCFALCLIWALYLTTAKYIIDTGLISVTGMTLFQRATIVVVLLIPFWRIPREKRAFEARHHLAPLLLVSAILTMLTYLYYWAFSRYDQGVANSAVLSRTDLVFAIVLGRLLLNERVRPTEYLAVSGMVVGVLIITFASATRLQFEWIGDLSVVSGAFLLTINAFIIRMRLQGCHNTVLTVYNNIFCVTILTAIYIALEIKTGRASEDIANYIARPDLALVNLAQGLLGALVFLLYYYCLKNLPVWEVRAFLLFMPFFAVPIAWFTLGDTPTPAKWIGMLVVTAFGLWLMALSRLRSIEEADGIRIESEGSQV